MVLVGHFMGLIIYPYIEVVKSGGHIATYSSHVKAPTHVSVERPEVVYIVQLDCMLSDLYECFESGFCGFGYVPML